MGCFSSCFRKPKRQRSRRPTKHTPCFGQILQSDGCVEAVQHTDVKQQDKTEILTNPSPDSIDGQKEKLNISGRRKVTFDLNVQFYKELPVTDKNHDNEEDKEEEEEGGREKIKLAKEKESNLASEISSSSSLLSFPSSNNYRYQNCRDSDDELDDELVSDDYSDPDYMGDDEDEEGENEAYNDSTDSMKHIPIQVKDEKVIELNEDEADGIKRLDSVLHPVENLIHWKAVKATAKPESQNKAKENKTSGQECEILRSQSKKFSCQEIAVDTSLSSWLAGPEAVTPSKSRASSDSVGNWPCSERTYSPKDFEDRPILGVLTVEDIRQFSATSTPRRSPTRSPDDMPIIGSVGSYWS